MIVLSSPTNRTDEISLIHALLEAGTERFHLRKPQLSFGETKEILESIESAFHPKIVLHQHYQLGELFNIKQIHVNAAQRKTVNLSKFKDFDLSTSTHSIIEFNALSTQFTSAFISPIFPSISKKGYNTAINWAREIQNRRNYHTKLIALGGIEAANIACLKSFSFDDYALLGAIWCSNNSIKNFELCLKNVL